MKKLLVIRARLVLLTYLLAWMSPALCYFFADPRPTSAVKVLITLAFFFVWHLAFKNFRKAVVWSLFFFLILLPFDLFFFIIYQEPPGTPVLLSIADTTLIEATDFMRGRGTLLFFAAAFPAVIWLMTLKAAQRGVGENWRCYRQGIHLVARPLLVLSVGFILLFAAAPAIERALSDGGHRLLAASLKTVDETILAPLANLRPIYPLGRFVSMGEFYRENTYLRYADQSKARFRYHARQAQSSAGRQIYVLVLGETARADRFALNGYSRGQPSFLASQQNLIPLTNIISPFTYSNLSVRAILTPAGLDRAHGHARSLVSAFREAGFKTYWISNQQPIGMRETEISHFSREADEAVFMNFSIRTMHKDGLYDEHLLGPLERFLARKEPKQFFVLHMLGSHDSYQRRYPDEFDILQPSLRSLNNPDHHNRRNKLEVENSYDNAMHYADYVLAKIIEAVEKEAATSALLYTADHGETLFDGKCERSGHGSSGKQEFPVAAMAWVSKEYKARWPDRFTRLAMNASAPITTEAIFPTALDLAFIETDLLDRSSSLVSASFRIRQRLVNAPEPLDWDTATTRGACNLLVAGEQDKETAVAGEATTSALP